MGSVRERIEDRIGTTIADKYRLLRLLGSGGMGAVYEAVNTWTERKVAIKVLLGGGSSDANLAARFMREARAATKIAHENIVQILDMGQDPADGSLYIVQEYLVGRDVRSLLDERGTLTSVEAAEILAPVMGALVVAHRFSIIHRDLKPENIFLTKSSMGAVVPKLIDFGIAKVNDEQSRGLTHTGSAMGTPEYMAPEQARGEKTVDAQTDVWAIGVILYEMLSGRYPYDGDNYNAVMVRIATERPRRIEEVVPTLPASLAAIVHKMLEPDRKKRYRSMSGALDALLAACPVDTDSMARLQHEGREDFEDAPTEMMDATSLASDTTHAGPDTSDRATADTTIGRTPREIRRAITSPNRSALGIGAAAVVAGMALGTVLLARRRDHGRAARSAASVASGPTDTARDATRATTYLVHVTAPPPAARLELDGVAIPGSSLVREFPRDGRRHVLRALADGYEPFSVTFSDAPPPPIPSLVPLPVSPTVGPPPRSTPVVPARTAPRTVPSPHRPRPARPVNGAPILGE